MENGEKELKKLDLSKIQTAVKLHTPIEITSYTLPRSMEWYIQEVMEAFLKECHQEHMFNNLSFCLGELLTNSKKANTKRVYFKLHNLDINNKEDYQKGMTSFKLETLSNIDYYLVEQKIAGLYVKFSIQLTQDSLVIQIKNNSVLTKWEKERIQKKLDDVELYRNEKAGFLNSLDLTEGAGLGIIIIILMLEKIGLTKNNYRIFSTDTETITQIILPLRVQDITKGVCLDCFKDQNKIPVLENAFKELKELLNNPLVDKSKLTNLISKDVTLTTLLIKNAKKKNPNCNKISQAINIIDYDELNKIFSNDNDELKIIKDDQKSIDFWKHCYQSAFYAYNIVRNLTTKNEFDPEEIYVVSLFNCLQEQIIENSDSTISNSLPKQNNKDERIQHLLYLAKVLPYYKEHQIEYYQIQKEALKTFGIESEEQLLRVVDSVK